VLRSSAFRETSWISAGCAWTVCPSFCVVGFLFGYRWVVVELGPWGVGGMDGTVECRRKSGEVILIMCCVRGELWWMLFLSQVVRGKL